MEIDDMIARGAFVFFSTLQVGQIRDVKQAISW